VASPQGVELLAGAAEAVRLLNEAGVPVVVVTNQSGIGRRLFDLEAYYRVEARVDELLAAEGARLDATYFCPHAPEEGCDCRKPGLALYRKAEAELGVETAGALFAGDRVRDVLAAVQLGGRGMLVAGEEAPYDGEVPPGVVRVPDLLTGVRELLGLPGQVR
jgi:D-glycero-D-manno-heptose 1,7-bisphosphate phosphatase